MTLVKTKTIILSGIIFLLLFYPIGCVFSTYSYRSSQISWLTKNVLKIKKGMTYQEVHSLLGYPSFVFYSTDKDIKKFRKINLRKSYFIDSETWHDTKTKPGEIDWLYFYGSDNSEGFPVFSFNSSTGKLISVGRRFFDP
jgi:hypothetical protein